MCRFFPYPEIRLCLVEFLERQHPAFSDLRNIPGIIKYAPSFHGRGLIQFGLLLPEATPVMRVAFTAAFSGFRETGSTLV